MGKRGINGKNEWDTLSFIERQARPASLRRQPT